MSSSVVGPRRRRKRQGLGDEAGTTLIELMVALSAGIVVVGAITALMLMTIRQTGRVTSHVEANQRARTTMTKIVNELHSACFFPRVTPIMGESTGTSLAFMHQSGEAVAPRPVRSIIELVNGELVQYEAEPTSGSGAIWHFPQEKGSMEPLMKGVAPAEGSSAVFTYYSYTGGKISASPLTAAPLGNAAATAVQVNISFRAAPEPPVLEDENSATAIQDSVLLRLTPPSYDSTNDNPPCE